MQNNAVEAIIGAVVLVVAFLFLAFAYTSVDAGGTNGYKLSAKFRDASGLSTGADIRISGVKVGTVTDITLDPSSYRATVDLQIAADVEIPVDTVAKISTDGLLGDSYLALVIGAEFDMLQPGEEIGQTQPGLNLESLVGQFIFSGEEENGGSGEAAGP